MGFERENQALRFAKGKKVESIVLKSNAFGNLLSIGFTDGTEVLFETFAAIEIAGHTLFPIVELPKTNCAICLVELTQDNVSRKDYGPDKGQLRLDSLGRAWCIKCSDEHDAAIDREEVVENGGVPIES